VPLRVRFALNAEPGGLVSALEPQGTFAAELAATAARIIGISDLQARPWIIDKVTATAPLTVTLGTLNPDQLAADEHAADLVGAGADVEQLGVAVVALDRPVLGVAGAAEGLHRLVGDLHGVF